MSNKKLQTEVDRTVKKCTEGLANYDDIYNRLSEASQNMRERLEADLKREIKKLQKQRDTIKQWINNDIVKDKTQLRSIKTQIEDRMESFKKCEKNSKTKAYSKEALRVSRSMNPRKERKLSPQQSEAKTWFEEQINALDDETETLEAELEKLNSSRSGKRHKNRKNNDSEFNKINARIESNKWHQQHLEQCLHKVLKGTIDALMYKDTILDDVEYYIQEAYEDEHYQPFEELYIEILESARNDDDDDDDEDDDNDDEDDDDDDVAVDDNSSIKKEKSDAVKDKDDNEDDVGVHNDDYDDEDEDDDDVDLAVVQNKGSNKSSSSKNKEKKEKSKQGQKTSTKQKNTQSKSNNVQTSSSNHSKTKAKTQSKKTRNKNKKSTHSKSRRNKKPKSSPSVSSVNSYRSDISNSTTKTNQSQHIQPMRLPQAMDTERQHSSTSITLNSTQKNISQQLLQQPLNTLSTTASITVPSTSSATVTRKKFSKIANDSASSTANTAANNNTQTAHSNDTPMLNGSHHHNASNASTNSSTHNHIANSSNTSTSSAQHAPNSNANTTSNSATNANSNSHLKSSQNHASHTVHAPPSRPMVPPIAKSHNRMNMSNAVSNYASESTQQTPTSPASHASSTPHQPAPPLPPSQPQQHRTKPPKHHSSYKNNLIQQAQPPLPSQQSAPSSAHDLKHQHQHHPPLPHSQIAQQAHQQHPPPALSASSSAGPPPPALTASRTLPDMTHDTNLRENSNTANMKPSVGPHMMQHALSATEDVSNLRVPSRYDDSLPPFSRSLTRAEMQILDIINDSYHKRPQPFDTFEPTFYSPDCSYQTPSYFPKDRRAVFDSPYLFKLLELDTLFYIFYYQPCTYQQYMAAKELKVKGWSFHTRYLAWFQRHFSKRAESEKEKNENSSAIDNEANNPAENVRKSLFGKGQHTIGDEKWERGTYIFFDRNQSWQMRMRENFRFDYQYLEDDDMVNVDHQIDWNKLATYGNGCGLIHGEIKKTNMEQQLKHMHTHSNMSKTKQQQISQIQSKSRSKAAMSSTSHHHQIPASNAPPPALQQQQPASSSKRYTASSQLHPTRPPTSFHQSANNTAPSSANAAPPSQGRFRPPLQHYRQQYAANSSSNASQYQSRR